MTKLRVNPAEDGRGREPAESMRNVFSLDALCLLLSRMRTNKLPSGLTFYEFAAGFKMAVLGYVCSIADKSAPV